MFQYENTGLLLQRHSCRFLLLDVFPKFILIILYNYHLFLLIDLSAVKGTFILITKVS